MILFIMWTYCTEAIYIKKYGDSLYMSRKKIDTQTLTYSTFDEALQFTIIDKENLSKTIKMVSDDNYVLDVASGFFRELLILFPDFNSENQRFRIEKVSFLKDVFFITYQDQCVTYEPYFKFFEFKKCSLFGTNTDQLFEIVSANAAKKSDTLGLSIDSRNLQRLVDGGKDMIKKFTSFLPGF